MEVLTIDKDKKFKVAPLLEPIFPIDDNKAYIRFRPIEHGMEMVQIFVNGEERLKGYGRKILKKFESIAKERGFKKFVIYSGATSKEGFGKFIVKMGYRYLGENIWRK